MSYEHDCEHHPRFISYPDAGKGSQPFCTLCEIERLQAELAGGAGLIATERQRQITEEGWGSLHDDHHTDESLLEAAYCYMMRGDYLMYATRPPASWPWDRKWWKPKDHIRNLVIAGALIAAEIDRLQREAGGDS